MRRDKFDAVAVKANANVLYLVCQGSNDLENWVSLSGVLLTISAEGYYSSAVVSNFGFAYARLRYVLVGDDGEYCVFAGGLKTFAE